MESFYLVGGTCLALRYGHRKSIDLDLFSITDFNNAELNNNIQLAGVSFSVNNLNNPVGLLGYINELKVDFVRHHHFKMIGKTITEDGIRMFSDRDIIAMKIFAILQKAQKFNKDGFLLIQLLN